MILDECKIECSKSVAIREIRGWPFLRVLVSLAGQASWLLLCLFLTQVAAQEDAASIVRKVRDTYDKLQTLQADFVQKYTWSLAGETQTLAGKLYLKRGDRYRVETEDQTIVTDGTTVWTYSHEKHQVFVDRLEKSAENPLPRELLVKYARDFKASLLGIEKAGSSECYRLRFVPRNDNTFVAEVIAWIEKGSYLATRIEQHDINDNVTVYELKNVQRDLVLADQLFTFKIPRDAEVIDLR